ncbi:MAG: RusA family crossover junction endodeoxyribonuclease [Anaerolineae bacterium]|nr:RusA family crossover junction endodeoxyribonuclease [Anaerolineae bacterium]
MGVYYPLDWPAAWPALPEPAAPPLLAFVVDGQPVPKARPRVTHGHAYTPERTRAYEQAVAWAARACMGGRDPLAGDLDVEIALYRKGKRRADLDNLVKAVSDGCNAIVWQDDAQIVALRSSVVYGDDAPRAVVRVRKAA